MAASSSEGRSEVVNEALLEEKVVELWPEYPCLYNVNSPDFKNRNLRTQAMEEIAQKVNQNVDWVKNKLRQLRNSYTKAKKTPPSGTARKNPTKRIAWLLDKLQFLAPHVAARPTVSNLDSPSPTPTSDSEDFSATQNEENGDGYPGDDSFSPEDEPSNIVKPKSTKLPTKPRTKSLKKQREEEEFQLLKGLANTLTQRDDNKRPKIAEGGECDTFGRYITESLQKLDRTTRHVAQFNINNILFQAQMGTLSQNQPEVFSLQQQQMFLPPQQMIQHHHQQIPPQHQQTYSQQIQDVYHP